MVVVVYETDNWAPFPPKKKWIRHYLEEYPSSDKNFSARPASSLTHVHNQVINGSNSVESSALLSTATLSRNSKIVATPVPSESAITNANSHAVISSIPTTFSSLANGSSLPSAVVTSVLSFSASPTITFTFTSPPQPPTEKNCTSLLNIPSPVSTSVRLPSPVPSSRQHPSPSVIQQNHPVPYSSPSPPSAPQLRNIPHHVAPIQLPQINQNSPTGNHVATAAAVMPHRTYPDRTLSLDNKRKMSSSGTREVHNKLEKNRRAHLKECFELLKTQVPAIQDEKKPSNLTILRTAIRYVQILRKREQDLESELELLARDKILNQQRLASLKKDLSAQYDNIDFNALLSESIEFTNIPERIENGTRDRLDYDSVLRNRENQLSNDSDDSLSTVKSRGETYYASSSPTVTCRISPLQISSPNVVTTTMSDNLPPQIHIVEAPTTVSFDKISKNTVVSPLQFLSSSTLRMITDHDQPIALMQQNGGDKLSESATLPKMAVHTGNTFTILGDSFSKITNGSSTTATCNPVSNSRLSSPNSTVQFIPGLSSPTSVSNNLINLVKPAFTQSAALHGATNSSSLGDKGNTTVPVQPTIANVGNHSFVVTQASSGQMLISSTSSHLTNNVMHSPPLLKTVSRLQSINGHQLVMKPATAAVVVVSSSTAAN